MSNTVEAIRCSLISQLVMGLGRSLLAGNLRSATRRYMHVLVLVYVEGRARYEYAVERAIGAITGLVVWPGGYSAGVGTLDASYCIGTRRRY